MAPQALNIGILADTKAHLTDLNQLVRGAGHNVVASIQISSNQLNQLPEVDAWVVRLDLQSDLAMQFVETLDSLEVTIIHDDCEDHNAGDGAERTKRFNSKINMCTGQRASSPLNQNRAKEVWVLAASAGGPEAVTQFLKYLPDTLQGIAFFYVQHIDTSITSTLQKAIVRNTPWQVFTTDKAHFVCEGCIYIVSPGHGLDLSDSGVVTPVAEPWSGPYKPSIDQVMAKVARVYGARSGAIIFSGMGDDGAKSCRYLKHSGGRIWAQSPQSATVDSMPDSALKTGFVTFQGTPEELAKNFIVAHALYQEPDVAQRQKIQETREVKI